MKVKNKLTFNGQFETAENFNSNLLRTRMKVFAFGNNRNGSSFDPNSFASSANSLKNIPIVAKYNVEEDDLEGHNVELKVKDGEYEFSHDTSPFGATSSDSNITFEEVNEGTETNPDIKTYVVIDNVYLWKRYDATKRIESWIAEGIVPKISMEIGNVEGNFSEDGYFQISNFEFEAITALGSDIEPCFPRAEIETYSKQSFTDEFKSMVYELSEALNLNQKGGKKMEKEIPAIPETSPTYALDMFTEAQFAEAVEMNLLFDTVEVEEVEVVVEPEVETIEEDEANPEEVVDYEAKFNTLSTEHTSLQSDFATLQTQLDELNTYKRQREESDIKAKFEGKLSDEEFAQVFTELKDSELDAVEDKLFALIGKKNFSIQSTPKSNVNKIAILSRKDDEKPYNPYGDIFEN